MALFPSGSPMWEQEYTLGAHRYISRERLMAILAVLPANALITPNRVGNLSVMAGITEDGNEFVDQLGYIELGDEQFYEMRDLGEN